MKKMTFKRYFIILFLISCNIACKNEVELLNKAKEFAPQYAIQSQIHAFAGDLNGDAIKDVILRFKIKEEPIENEHFYILLGKNDGTLEIEKEDIFQFDNKHGIAFDAVTILKNGDFVVNYIGTEDYMGSYRKILFKHAPGASDYNYWILHRDEELFQHKVYAPAPQEPILVNRSDMRSIGGEQFGLIQMNLYDVMLRMKVKSFIPDSTIECNAYSGDLNRDQFDDIILRYKMKNEYETREHFLLLLGQQNSKYELATRNDSLELDNVNGTSFDAVVIKNGYFSLEYRGYGNTSGSYEIIIFKYSKEENNWFLHRSGNKYIHRYFTEGEAEEHIRTQKDFGKILFEEYGF